MNSLKKEKPHALRICWWNVNNFFHYDRNNTGGNGKARWPSSKDEYSEKCRRIDNALSELQNTLGNINVLCLCEITKIAAENLRDRLFPGYKLISLDAMDGEPTLQVAILHEPNSYVATYLERPPIVTPAIPRNSRPMAVLDVETRFGKIRVIACHWQARIDEEGSEIIRGRIADYLSMYCYEFIQEDSGKNHVIIVGDLNEEPFEKSLRILNAHRHRLRSQKKIHWADHDVKRMHLYNASWRHLGEKHPYPTEIGAENVVHCAGTYYWKEHQSWRHFDQIIVSGGLLQDQLPLINENNVHVVSSGAFLAEGLPSRFEWNGSEYTGLSDHLPVFAELLV